MSLSGPRTSPSSNARRKSGGRYHVLVRSPPIGGVGPGHLRIAELGERIGAEGVAKLIVATNPTVEGDVTAMCLSRELKASGVRITRLARGLPVGGDLDYAGGLTLDRALTGRLDM